MSECKLDHSLQDVKLKLEQQAPYLSVRILQSLQNYLTSDLPQHSLNELFHLLKKFDLSSEEEQQKRSEHLQRIINNKNVSKG